MNPNEIARTLGIDNRRIWLPLRCGPLTMYFDPVTAALREIRLGDTEIVQAIGPVVRERNWGTVLPRTEVLQFVQDAEEFALTFLAGYQDGGIDFSWSARIAGQADGTLQFELEGTAHASFLRNRIGFCILYPGVECAGRPCVAETVTGTTERGIFPELISAHQPFRNLRSFRFEALPGTWVDMRLEGDTFEMEDHRNWTDASYKIYSTPLELPFPVEMTAGAQIVQSVTLTLSNDAPKHTYTAEVAAQPETVTLHLSNAPSTALPQIGLGVASHGKALTLRESERLNNLALSHFRLDIAPGEPDWETALQQAGEEAQRPGIGLEAALFLSDAAEQELTDLARVLSHAPIPILRWLVFHRDQKTTPSNLVRRVREVLSPLMPDALIGGGTNAYFAELNRGRPQTDLLDCVCWSVNPQVHAFDMASLVENLEAQAPMVQSARTFCGGLPLIISPLTLRPRFNVYATGPEPVLGSEYLPPQVDVRQPTLFAAGWTLGSLKALCESGVHSVTCYETTGWRGVMETEAGSPLPHAFPSAAGSVFPMYHVFADIGAFAGGDVLPLTSSAPRKITGLALCRGSASALLCANLTSDVQKVRMHLPSPVTQLSVRQMEASNLEAWAQEPEQTRQAKERSSLPASGGIAQWELPPFAYARFDWSYREE